LIVRKPINGSQAWFAEVSFENPVDAKNPLIVLTEFAPEQTKISIQSPEMRAIKNRHTYKAVLKAYSDPARTVLVAMHDIYVRFDVPDHYQFIFGVKFL
jgi:hypothetical protein